MERAFPAVLLSIILVVGVLSTVFTIHPVKASTLAVPDDYATIQEAVNAASSGDTVFVKNGIYCEHVMVNKSISLVGENRNATIIDGGGNGVPVRILAYNVSLSGFKVTNGYKECIQVEGYSRFCRIYNNIVSYANERGISINGANNSVHDNIVHDCGKYGAIDVIWSHNCTVFNNIVYSNSWWWGLSINNGTNNKVYNNTAYSNNHGMFLDWSSHDNSVFNNTFHDNWIGILVGGASYRNSFWNNDISRCMIGAHFSTNTSENTFTDNTISECGNPTQGGVAIYFSQTHSNHLKDNVLTNNTYGFSIEGWSIAHFVHDIDASNLVDEKPMCYLINQSGVNLSDEYAFVAIVNSTNVRVSNLTLLRSGFGVLLAYSNSSVIENVAVTTSGAGIGLVMSNNNTLNDNSITDCLQFGVVLQCSGNNTLRNNAMTNNTLNFGIGGLGPLPPTLSQFINNVDISNTVDNKPIHYLVNESDEQIPASAGCLIVVNSTNIALRDACLKKNAFGILAICSADVHADNITIEENLYGAAFLETEHSSIDSSMFENNYITGVTIGRSANTTVVANEIIGIKLPQMGPQGQTNVNIAVANSTDTTIENNTVTNSIVGIDIANSTRNCLVGNRATGNDEGITLQNSCNNTLSSNVVENNTSYGIYLLDSANNTLKENSIVDNRYNFGVDSPTLAGFLNDIDDSNTVCGKPIYYWIDKSNGSVSSDGGFVALINCNRTKVEGASIADNVHGILLAYSTNCSVLRSNVTGTKVFGILLQNSSNSIVYSNNLADNLVGVGIDSGSSNTIMGNLITNSTWGIAAWSSSQNCFIGNNLTSNRYGISIGFSSSNIVYHNNFIDNQYHTLVDNSTIAWDDGYPSGGNYWSDYTGVDLCRGTYQNEAGSDGIGDTPHVIDAYDQDSYPLMKPFGGIHDIAVASVTTAKTVVGQGCDVNVTVRTLNYGVGTETFNLTISVKSALATTEIAEFTIAAAARNQTTVSFTWNTAGFERGNYTLIAFTEPVANETYTADNTCLDGIIKVTIPGDVDGNFAVTILDVVKITGIYASKLGDLDFNPNSDINDDGQITILDVVICTGHYGQKWP